MINKLKIMTVGILLILMSACQDYDTVSPDLSVEREIYDGSLLEYLSDGAGNKLNQTFDSMLVVIDGVPGLREELEREDVFYTVFAIPNECFERAFRQLNAYRAEKKLGDAISFNQLLIEPFTVEIPLLEIPNPPMLTRYFDYRGQVDSLFCRYVFPEKYSTNEIEEEIGNEISVESLRYKYQMNITCLIHSASGIVGGGNRSLTLNDMNESQLKEMWSTTDVVWKDIYTRNAIVHILTGEHTFGFKQFINYFYNLGHEEDYESEF